MVSPARFELATQSLKEAYTTSKFPVNKKKSVRF